MIHWLEQTASSHPDLARGEPPSHLLSEPELEQLARLTVPKRRRDWLLGRWTAKQVLRSFLQRVAGLTVPLDALVVKTEPGGAPVPHLEPGPQRRWRGGRLPLAVSISHSGDRALCAISPFPRVKVGADIEKLEPRSQGMVEDFFTRQERARVGEIPAGPLRDAMISTIWSGKEAVLKALGMGLRVDTRKVTCLPGRPRERRDHVWIPMELSLDPSLLPSLDGRAGEGVPPQSSTPVMTGWWMEGDGYVRTMAVLRPARQDEEAA